MRLIKVHSRSALIVAIVFVVVGLGWSTEAVRAQKLRANATAQQPVFNEYKGIRLGMTATEVRAKLGEPTLKGDDQDLYMVSQTETAQFVYDRQFKTKAISIDYMGGVGAPDPKTVVDGELEVSARGQYKMVRYDSLGFWVSFNRTAGPVVVVSITMARID